MNRDRFLFFENFRRIASSLPDDLRLKFYDALTAYVFDEIEPEDPIIKSLIIAISPSLNKEDKRGGNHNPAGQNQYSKAKQENDNIEVGQNNNDLGQNEVKVGQSGQSFLETETGNKKQETEDNIPPSEDKSSSVGIFSAVAPKKIKTLVPLDWQPEEVVAQKLKDRGLDVPKVVEKFINSCRAKGLKYIDFNRAILAWDWSKDESLKLVDEEKCWF